MMAWRALRALGLTSLVVSPLWGACATQTDAPEPPVGGARQSPEGGASGQTGPSSSGGAAGSPESVGGAAGQGGALAGAGVAGVPTDVAEGGVAGAAPGSCQEERDCDDHNPCTTDTCQFERCSYTANTEPCADDGDPCTDDVCEVSACTHPDNGSCECQGSAECDDHDVCTDDACDAGTCTYTNNTAACADDGSSCTKDQCAAGECRHTDNGSCECSKAGDCDDSDPCTSNQCTAAGKCAYPSNGSCPVGVPFKVDTFNSTADWLAGKTTPDKRGVAHAGFSNTNLEGDKVLYVAAAAAATLELELAPMVGLGHVSVSIRAEQLGTAGMVHLGVYDGAAWSEQALSKYGTIPTDTYATLVVPLSELGVPASSISKLRLRFVPSGTRAWRIDEIAVTQ